ncbi:thioredoxin domain protein (macronuclear) [Tetrahymena thermophila SB210]|uniref:Thioredoxin domain protein n=2 Tax=Tetrahymena thermophila TaxID=5911 RepID=I7LVW0_TETTS|nr:thioredoxin domain protein [Tetrahymena thermophila SB210]EAR99924.3 thioredoxin domain protein [Tetrahymena thermophila SB210]|eukprot:XP_001020169.3 thioredoxin domain protein [Tetrahymena thermophila SB210]
MAEQKHRVVVNLYDLSGGMARVFSPMFLQKQIDGIWHTGCVVYGKEFYFGGGICSGLPKQTPYGTPVQQIDVGETEVPEEVFTEFLRDISDRFTMDKYDLFKNNCNNFTDECTHFLTGQHIPEYITGLPDEVLNTPMGQMIKPLVDQMQQSVVNASGQSALFPAQFEGVNNPQQMFGNNQQQQQQQQQAPIFPNGINNTDILNKFTQLNNNQPVDMKKVEEATDLMDYFTKVEGQKAVIIDFNADWCGPCQVIKPIFAQYSEEYPNIKFISVNTEKNKEVAQQFGIQSLPTFITLHEGEISATWKGANQVNLKNNLDKLAEKLK